MATKQRKARLRRQIRNAKEKDAMLNNSTTPPDKGWFLQTRRTLTLGNQVFPAGAKVSAADCGRNLRTHLDTGAVWWASPGTPIAAKPAKLPTPAKLQPLPTLEFIDIPDDPEASWRQTLMTERCGSHAAAMDLLMGNAQARALQARDPCRVLHRSEKAEMSALGQKQTSDFRPSMSALPPSGECCRNCPKSGHTLAQLMSSLCHKRTFRHDWPMD